MLVFIQIVLILNGLFTLIQSYRPNCRIMLSVKKIIRYQIIISYISYGFFLCFLWIFLMFPTDFSYLSYGYICFSGFSLFLRKWQEVKVGCLLQNYATMNLKILWNCSKITQNLSKISFIVNIFPCLVNNCYRRKFALILQIALSTMSMFVAVENCTFYCCRKFRHKKYYSNDKFVFMTEYLKFSRFEE